ncbi:nucleoside phosphorylase [Legionella hackeliae]|uniref:Uridine phosphorylase n=1 Tax=Legionella hackeliae TaxID=449 RepID=A0A0A8UPW7_LEGHA|nr:nucleoside phosphorylase [Legionella hackeliae]KTD09757.1 purine nucleoside phosphorylase II [Legionella hackeliae]CEK10915.1 Uridine phosphorylase [Legionella hackeliae]STX47653.1 purine nucleoside phosphorylase II [Legionella hackeliae]
MIKPAELPFNKRGAVYHLDLREEEIADFIITVGDPGRVQQVSQYFDRLEFQCAHREFVTHTGYIGSQRLSVVSTGIGMPNIDIAMTEIDALANIDLATRTLRDKTRSFTIIRLGTTGGIKHDCKPGDVMISRYGIGFDTFLNYYDFELSSELKDLQIALQAHLGIDSEAFFVANADEQLVENFKSLGTVGITGTCGGFYGPQGRGLRLPLRYPAFLDKLSKFSFAGFGVTNLEMETAAILGLGALLGHRCLSISVVLANRMTGEFLSNIKLNVDKFIISFLELIPSIVNE